LYDETEFEEDLKRFQYLRKLFNKYKQGGDLKERLVLNHLIIMYNVFGPAATDMLFMKLEDYYDCLKPFVVYLNYMPIYIRYDGKQIYSETIKSDQYITEILKGI